MRIVTEKRLREFARKHPDAVASLLAWVAVVRKGRWANLTELRRTFPTADGVTVASRRTATVFNIRGNHYRLITAVHYDKQRVFVMRFLTHAEYDKGSWKDAL
jgi:mRNA interferase HigB